MFQEQMVLRHHNEAESLNAVQKMDWEWKLGEIPGAKVCFFFFLFLIRILYSLWHFCSIVFLHIFIYEYQLHCDQLELTG